MLSRLPKKRQVAARLTTLTAWEVPKQSSSIAPDNVWTNADQDPVPRDKQTWGAWAFVGYWFSDLVTISTWEVGSSILSAGLGTRDAILIMLVAGVCNMIPTVLNGAIGARHHIPFPIATRASMGYWFGYFAVVIRGILAAFWFGVQSYGGSTAVTQAITATWPSYANLPNHLPVSADITTQGMLSYIIFHIIQVPFLLVSGDKLRYFWLAKSITVPPMAIGILIWVCLKANGSNAILTQQPTVQGSTYAWTWLATMTSITGGYSTLAVNISDFSRFSKTENAQMWQGLAIPILKVVTALFGIVATGACRVAFGKDMWNPVEILALWTGSGGRFLSFFCSVLWIIAQIGCNVSANSYSFANDTVSILPKYINIRRGSLLCILLGGFALVPWIMASSAYRFLNFMSGCAIFLAPIAGLLTCDYWLVRRCKLDVPAPYNPHGRYRYWRGVNWRALVVVIGVVTPLLPGLAYAVTPATVSITPGLKNLYSVSWLYAYHATVLLYTVLNLIWPASDTLVGQTVSGYLPVIVGEGVRDSESIVASVFVTSNKVEPKS